MPQKRVKKNEEDYGQRPGDPTLDGDEYFVKICNPQTGSERVFKGFIFGISFDHYGRNMYQLTDGKRILRSDNIPYDEWWYKSQMYDNKEDCRDDAHCCCDDWEE